MSDPTEMSLRPGSFGVRVYDRDLFSLVDYSGMSRDDETRLSVSDVPALIRWLRETYPQHFAEAQQTPKPEKSGVASAIALSLLTDRVYALERRVDAARDAL